MVKEQTLQVQIQHAVSANPFSSLLYAPSIENVEGAQGATSPAVKVQEKHQLSVLFRFHDDSYPPVSSMPGSPVLAAFKRPELIDEATSPLYTSQADIDTSALVKKKIVKPEIVDEDNDDQIIQAKNVLREEASQFPSPMGYWGTAPLSRVEKARLLNAGFNILLDEDGHRPVTLSPSAKGTRIELGLEKKDLRFNDIHFNFMGLTFNAELFEHFGGRLVLKSGDCL